MNYKTIRYPGHCAQMRLLMNDLKLNQDRATLKRMLENAVPQTLQDVVIVYAAVTGKQDGELREENYVNKVYPQMIAGRLWSAIQVTTAAGITAVVDLVLADAGKYHGFVRPGAVPPARRFSHNRFGRYYAPGGTKDISARSGGQPARPAISARAQRGTAGESPMSDVDNLISPILTRLGLEPINPGAWSRQRRLVQGTRTAPLIKSVNPADGELLAQVRRASAADYEAVMRQRARSGRAWRSVPAPKRGEAVRLLGEELRRHKDDLGTLVSLENGKIKAEGLGEVQEMIDIADFAVGQSRMLYGLTMHSERPQHRMYEQWHPLGRRRNHLARSTSPWPCGPGTRSSRPSAATPRCGSPRRRRRSCAHRRPAHLQPGDARRADCRRSSSCSSTPAPSSPRASSTIGAWRWSRSPARPRWAARSANASPRASARACWNSAATTPSSSTSSPNLDLAVPAIVFGAVGTAGQRCTTHASRVRARSRSDELEKRLVHAYTQVRIGNPLEAGTLMGPLIDSARGRALHAGASRRRSAAGGDGAHRRRTVLDGPGQLRRARHRRGRATTGRSCRRKPSRRFCT